MENWQTFRPSFYFFAVLKRAFQDKTNCCKSAAFANQRVLHRVLQLVPFSGTRSTILLYAVSAECLYECFNAQK